MTDDFDMSEYNPPRSEKEAAVRQWDDAVDDIPDDNEHKEFFENADIHDWDDRREIEELIDHILEPDVGAGLDDAFDDLRKAFDDLWD